MYSLAFWFVVRISIQSRDIEARAMIFCAERSFEILDSECGIRMKMGWGYCFKKYWLIKGLRLRY